MDDSPSVPRPEKRLSDEVDLLDRDQAVEPFDAIRPRAEEPMSSVAADAPSLAELDARLARIETMLATLVPGGRATPGEAGS